MPRYVPPVTRFLRSLDPRLPRAVHTLQLGGLDPEGKPLAFAVADPPSHGALSGTPPSLVYAPAPGYRGADAFTFTVSDSASTSGKATVSITVTPVNHLPVAVADGASTDRG